MTRRPTEHSRPRSSPRERRLSAEDRRKKASEGQQNLETTAPPLRRDPPSPFWTLGVAVLGIALIAALFFAIVREVNHDAGGAAPKKKVVPASLGGSASVKAWLSFWQEEDPYLSASEFSLVSDSDLKLEEATVDEESDLDSAQVLERLVVSPGDERAIDYLSSFKSELDPVVNLYEGGVLQPSGELASCDESCTFDRVSWENESVAYIFGRSSESGGKGLGTCPSNDFESPCSRVLTVHVLDFLERKLRVYESAPHILSGSKIEREKLERWQNSQPLLARLRMGLYEDTELEQATMRVTGFHSTGIQAEDSEGNEYQLVRLSEEVDTLAGIELGSTVRVFGAEDDEGMFVTAKVEVTVPALIVPTDPIPLVIESRRTNFSFEYRKGLDSIRLEIRDDEDEIVVGKSAEVEEGEPTTIAATLPYRLQEGDVLRISITPNGASERSLKTTAIYRP